MNETVASLIRGLCAASPANRLPEAFDRKPIYADPVIGVAGGDDPIFARFKEVAGPEHLTPAEMWLAHGFPDAPGLFSRLRVLAMVFPYASHIREAAEESTDPAMPPEVYCVARNGGDAVMIEVAAGVVRYLSDAGYSALSGETSSAFRVFRPDDVSKIRSNWSQRHIAFAAGLGTMSLHEGLITEVGCNHRLASIITDAPLAVTPRRSDEPYANCLYFARGTCGKCIERCPEGAITPAGHDKAKCMAYGRKVEAEMSSRPLRSMLRSITRVIDGQERVSYPVGCALCQFGVPCGTRNPVSPRP